MSLLWKKHLDFQLVPKSLLESVSSDFQLLTLAWFVCKSVKYWLTDLNEANWLLVLMDVLYAARVCI